MEKFPKARFIVLTILVITLVNVLAMGIILRQSFRDPSKNSHGQNKDFKSKGFDFLKEQLNLSANQEELFKTERDSFFSSANKIFDELENSRIQMIHELVNNQPDTAKLYLISDNMGEAHGKLKRNVVDHMLKLRSYCNPDQLTKLDSMYKILIRTESPWRKKHQTNDSANQSQHKRK